MESEPREEGVPNIAKRFLAKLLGRRAGVVSSEPGSPTTPVKEAKEFGKLTDTTEEIVEGARGTHWSHPDSPTGGLPPEDD